MSDRLCGLCKGGCCSSGDDHAYLSALTMFQQMQRHPAWNARQLFNRYRSMLPGQSMQDSCINHTSHGCALPRELRSDVCNAFYCDVLKAYQDQGAQSAANPVLVIQRSDSYHSMPDPDRSNELDRVFLLSPNTTRSVDWKSGRMAAVKFVSVSGVFTGDPDE